MKPIFKTLFGSHLYGTNIETSDKDYKGVFLPTDREVILRTAPSTYQEKTNNADYKKNGKDDVDLEMFSLSKFMELASQGQTIFFDTFFAPKEFWAESSDVWLELQKNKDKLIHKRIDAALGYAKSQADKYSAKGVKLVALQHIVDFLNIYREYPRLCLEEIFKEDPYALLKSIVPEESLQYILFPEEIAPHLPEGKIKYLEVCGKKAGFTSNVKFALQIFTNTLKQYGDRAKAASIDGVDWKAMYHALRIPKQSEELLLTGHITFPRPEKDLLIQIRNGLLSFDHVSDLIQQGFEDVKAAELKSTLPESSDKQFIDDFVYDTFYKHQARNK